MMIVPRSGGRGGEDDSRVCEMVAVVVMMMMILKLTMDGGGGGHDDSRLAVERLKERLRVAGWRSLGVSSDVASLFVV
ncbi:hypothetical protein LWI29_003731 [Acer saccharum]|uniref:Uncharacterized protein n=1 Tax=Acer saccharum TaxID=4024 RepID=A0AA39VWQ8_ACESA|nr:hypothetical protein LWI29_003731 [Acer saccharum]